MRSDRSVRAGRAWDSLLWACNNTSRTLSGGRLSPAGGGTRCTSATTNYHTIHHTKHTAGERTAHSACREVGHWGKRSTDLARVVGALHRCGCSSDAALPALEAKRTTRQSRSIRMEEGSISRLIPSMCVCCSPRPCSSGEVIGGKRSVPPLFPRETLIVGCGLWLAEVRLSSFPGRMCRRLAVAFSDISHLASIALARTSFLLLLSSLLCSLCYVLCSARCSLLTYALLIVSCCATVSSFTRPLLRLLSPLNSTVPLDWTLICGLLATQASIMAATGRNMESSSDTAAIAAASAAGTTADGTAACSGVVTASSAWSKGVRFVESPQPQGYNPRQSRLLLFQEWEAIGSGSYGRVFSCTSSLDETKYAIKEIACEPFEVIDKLREARHLAKLSHPHIVRYHSVWQDSCAPRIQVNKLAYSCRGQGHQNPLQLPAGQLDPPNRTCSVETCSQGYRSYDFYFYWNYDVIAGGSDYMLDVPVCPACAAVAIPPKYSNTTDVHCQIVFQSVHFIYLHMEWCAETLEQSVRRHWRMTGTDVARSRQLWGSFVQLVDAIRFCHSNSVYHRDLKSKNVLVDVHGWIKLADFGLAHSQQEPDGPVTVAVSHANRSGPFDSYERLCLGDMSNLARILVEMLFPNRAPAGLESFLGQLAVEPDTAIKVIKAAWPDSDPNKEPACKIIRKLARTPTEEKPRMSATQLHSELFELWHKDDIPLADEIVERIYARQLLVEFKRRRDKKRNSVSASAAAGTTS